jgi:hypothetical protein
MATQELILGIVGDAVQELRIGNICISGGVVALHRKRRAAAEASFVIRDEPVADSLDRSELAKRLAVQIVLDKQED